MNPFHRQKVAFSLLIGCLLAATVWSYWEMESSRADAVEAATDAVTCAKLVARINHLRQKPSLAGLQEIQQGELTSRIEIAAKSALVPLDSLVRITPEAGRRLGDTPYKEKPTQVLLRGVTLRQLIVFLHNVVSGNSGGASAAGGAGAGDGGGLQVKTLRIVAPREQDKGELWTAETSLVYLVYSPKTESAPPKKGL